MPIPSYLQFVFVSSASSLFSIDSPTKDHYYWLYSNTKVGQAKTTHCVVITCKFCTQLVWPSHIMLAWKTFGHIYTHISLLVIAESGRHGTRGGGRCDHPHDNTCTAYSLKLSLNLYIAGMCWHCQTNKIHTFHYCIQTMKLNNVQLV